jgi:hypothetical protein
LRRQQFRENFLRVLSTRLPWPFPLRPAHKRRLARLLSVPARPTLRSTTLRVSQRRMLTVYGMASQLVSLLNDAYWGPRIRALYKSDGWWGVIEYLYAQRQHLAEERGESKRYDFGFLLAESLEGLSRAGGEAVVRVPERSLEALMEAVHFARWRWQLSWCDGQGGHWYVRQPLGRRPRGCLLHSSALRQADFRQKLRAQGRALAATETRKRIRAKR